jgi:hypothetical protein
MDKVSALTSTPQAEKSAKRTVSYDIHNISPREMDKLTLEMFQRGEISLRERLPFLPLDTERLARETGQDVQIKYHSRVWDDPDRKRDMLLEFNNILNGQLRDGDSLQNIEVTRNAITLLKRIDQHPSFERVLRETIGG